MPAEYLPSLLVAIAVCGCGASHPDPEETEGPASTAPTAETVAASEPGLSDELSVLHMRVFDPVGPAPDDMRQAERMRYALFLEEERLRACLPSVRAADGGFWRFVLHAAYDGRGHIVAPGGESLALDGAPVPVAECMLRIIGAIDLTRSPPPALEMTLEVAFEP